MPLHDVAVHDAAIPGHLVIGHRTVEQAAIVPHDEIAVAPAMRVDVFGLRRVPQQCVEQRGALVLRHAEDVQRVVAEIERLRAGFGVGAHQRVIDRRQVVGVIAGPAAALPLKNDAQSVDPAPRLLRQRGIGERRIGKFGVAAFGRQLDRVQRRQRRRHRVIGLVGMPAIVGALGEPVRGVAVGVEIGGHVRHLAPLVFAAMAAMRLDLAELGRETVLLLAAQRLPGKDRNAVRAQGGPNPVARRSGSRTDKSTPPIAAPPAGDRRGPMTTPSTRAACAETRCAAPRRR